MDSRNLTPDQLLDYVYDLLEPAERNEVEQLLRESPACREALVQAQKTQKLFGEAARAEHPTVRFEAPATTNGPVILSSAPRRSRPRWALAAAAALLVAILGGAGAYFWHDYDSARSVAERGQKAAAAAHAEVQRLQDARAHSHELLANKLDTLRKEIEERHVNVIVRGPQVVQPGAPNPFIIQTLTLQGQAAAARLEVRVRGEGLDKPIFEDRDIASRGVYALSLPPNLPLKPNAKLTLEVLARREGGPEGHVSTEVSLAAPVYVTHLVTDKPMYKPGEVVRFRSLTLERFSLKPPDDALHLAYAIVKPSGERVELAAGADLLHNANGQPIHGPDGKPVRGIGAGEWTIGDNDPGGEYTLVASDRTGRFLSQERKFIVNKYERPRLNKELEWGKKSYGPGEEALANCKVARAEGGVPVANRQVQVTILIDGRTYGLDGKPASRPADLKTDDAGHVKVRFKLPADVQRGEGTLAVRFEDGGSVETLAKPIPIVSRKLNIDFFPEGGYLIAGLPNRVYFQARTMLGKPADLKGRIVDASGKVVFDGVFTLTDPEHPGVNQGMGVFEFTPAAGTEYELKIDSPAGTQGTYKLPETREDGVVLAVPTGVTKAKDPIRAIVRSGKSDRNLLVGAYCRGRLMDQKPITLKKGESQEVELHPAQEVGGVYRITVFEEWPGAAGRMQLVPRAERLVYRGSSQALHVGIKTDRSYYVPGEKVTLSFTATDENKQPTPAIVTVAVVDKSVVTLADEKTARSMPTHFLLTTEVRKPQDLEHTDFLLTGHDRAREALDLLLGTQGWRRFAEQNPEEFRRKHSEEAERLLVTIGQSSHRVNDMLQEKQRQTHEEHQREVARLEDQHQQAQVNAQETRSDATILAAAAKVNRYDRFFRQLGQRLPELGIVAGMLLLVVGLVVAMLRSGARYLPLYAGGLVGVCLLGGISLLTVSGLLQDEATRQTAAPGGVAVLDAAKAMPPAPDAAPQDMPMEREERAAGMGGRPLREGAGAPNLNMPQGAMKPLAAARPQALPMAPPAPAPRAPMANRMAADKKADLAGQAGGLRLNARPAQGAMPFKAPMPAGPVAADARERDKAMFGEGAGKGEAFRQRGAEGRLAKGAAEAGRKDLQLEQEFKRVMPRADDAARRAMPGGFAGGGAMPGLFAKELADEVAPGFFVPPPPPPPLVVREYAHASTSTAEVRNDFTETLHWHPVLVLPGGKGQASFQLSDSVTTFEVKVFGHTLDGRIGSAVAAVESRLPFSIEPKVPIEINSNDTLEIPVSIANNTDTQRAVSLRMNAQGLKLLDGQATDQLQVGAQQRQRRVFRFKPDLVEGTARLQLEGETQPFAADSIRRVFQVVPEGFPVVASKSDLLEKTTTIEVVLPETWVKGTLKLQANVYPSTLADLQKGLEALLREPGGCFEQTSTSNYPNLLILDYLRESEQSKPEVESRAKAMLARGYTLLTSYECPYDGKGRHGYEWFGARNNGHEALTAYGLMQFRDMARVHGVDAGMIERTRQWLMEQRDGQGGFKRNPRALDTFGRAPQEITNAYIIWSLTESGKDDDVTRELDALAGKAKASKDPYFVSLVANSLLNRDRRADALDLLKGVAKSQKDDGHLEAEKTSITGSGGRDLQIETTALAVLGWLKANEPATFNEPVQKAVRWIGQQRGGYGGFGSTQSTILALKALIGHAKANKKTPEAGELRVFIGDVKRGEQGFPAGVQDAVSVELADAEQHLKPGKNVVRLEMSGDRNVFPATVTWSYRTIQPVSAEGAAVRLTTALSKTEADEGDTVRLTATVENTMDKGQGMAVAVIGIPAGLTLPEDLKQLKQHAELRDDGRERGLISYFEVRGRELVLYWRDLAPKQKIEVPVDLTCRVPGEYRGPASRAYLYYNADVKHWVEPLRVSIKASK